MLPGYVSETLATFLVLLGLSWPFSHLAPTPFRFKLSLNPAHIVESLPEMSSPKALAWGSIQPQNKA